MRDTNHVVLIGRLESDPELRHTPAGTSVATLRVSFISRRKVEGEWRDKPNYVDVEVWGGQAESAARHLSARRQVAVEGRLEWSEYEGQDGQKRQVHKIVADSLQFLAAAPRTAGADLVTSGAEGVDDDADAIPF